MKEMKERLVYTLLDIDKQMEIEQKGHDGVSKLHRKILNLIRFLRKVRRRKENLTLICGLKKSIK